MTRKRCLVSMLAKWTLRIGVFLSSPSAALCNAQPCDVMQDLGTLGGNVSRVSADGSVIVGDLFTFCG